jgi:hypothetical protein
MHSLTPAECKRRTGFEDVRSILQYALVLFDGSVDQLVETQSMFTWLEEIEIFLEILHGRTFCRWDDAEKLFNAGRRSLQRLSKRMMKVAQRCRGKWPIVPCHEEDKALRSQERKD